MMQGGGFAKRKVARYKTIPAPVGGWNARDALAAMSPLDAVTLDNFFPITSGVMLRKGYTQWATGLTTDVESLLPYSSATAQKLFAVSGGSIYDATSSGAIGAAVVTGLTNSYWQSINISTAGGSFLIAVNGADAPRLYDGTTWGTTSITGVAQADLININLFKNRVWLIEKNSLRAWYLGTDAISGAASQFNLQSVASKGGYLVAMGTWTIDAGEGVDDYAVFVTSRGEIIVYQGTDPASATTWALKGVWQVGAPLGRRCLIKYAGDLLFVGYDGVLPMASALQSSRVNPKVAVTNKIQGAMSEVASLYPTQQGWQLDFCPKDSRLLLNVPVSTGNQVQFAMNTITGSWGRFTGVGASCWAQFNDWSYFGGNGYVGRFWDGASDNGTAVSGTALQAFDSFGSMGATKRWTMAQLLMQCNGSPTINANINVDYDQSVTTAPVQFDPSVFGLWDTGIWDSSLWAPNTASFVAWLGLSGVGKVGGMMMQATTSTAEIQWQATNFVYEQGEFL